MTNKILFCFVVFSFFKLTFINAQIITGKITDPENKPIPFASVGVKGTNLGTTSNDKGFYSINVPENKNVLIYSFVGYESQEIVINSRNVINVTLKLESTSLDEVVVIGYGLSSRKNIISSVSRVQSDDIKRLSVSSVDMALQGTTPGLVASANTGAPGAGNTVRLRGVTSISGSNSPLYIVDGIPIFSGNVLEDIYGGQGNNTLSNLSTSDIESIEILKDASATAIYGARASNGVILITTKRGKEGKAKIEFNATYAFQNPIKTYKTMNLGEYLRFADAGYANYNPSMTSRISYNRKYASKPDLKPESSEMQEIYAKDSESYVDMIKNKNAPLYEVNLGISGGNNKTRYYMGGSYYKQDGTIKGQDYDRKSARINMDQNVLSWLKLNGGFSISDEKVNRINGDNSIYAPLTTAILEVPGIPVYNEDGSFNINDFSTSNPVQNTVGVIRESKTQRYLGNLGFNADIAKGLVFSSKLSIDRLYVSERIYNSSDTKEAQGTGYAFKGTNNFQRLLSTTTLNYIKSFEKFNINVLAGFEYQKSKSIFSKIATKGFPSTKLTWPISASTPILASAYETENKIASYFARFSLNFDDKYLFETSLRADASSKFGKNNRIGYFPAVSAGWKMHNESWFNIPVINELKLKAGWGLTGNESGIGNFASLFLASNAYYGEYPGLALKQIGDSNLSWETTGQISTGFDLGLFNDRITIAYEYFNKKTKDILLNTPIPISTGFGVIMSNVGEMKNFGHEILISARILEGKLKWNAAFSLSTLKNKITKLYKGIDGDNRPINYGFVSRVDVGESLGAFFVYKNLGLNDEGDVIYETGDDGILNEEDKYYAGKPLPDFTGYFNTNLSYKGFDLGILFQFSQGFELYNSTMMYAGASGNIFYGKLKNQMNFWTPTNTNTSIPRPIYGSKQASNNKDSDRFVEDGSYLRFKNLTFGYTIPKELTNLKIRVYFSVDNLITWTNYSGLDPEVNAFGSANVSLGNDFFTQGQNRIYKFGINVIF